MRVSPSAGVLAAARRGRGNLRVGGTNEGLLVFFAAETGSPRM